MRRDENETKVLLVAKLIDYFLLSGNTDTIRECIADVRKRFDFRKVVIDERFFPSGSEVTAGKIESNTMSMHPYKEQIQPIDLSVRDGNK